MRPATVLVLLAAACGDKAIEVTLVAPASESAQPVSYACVDHVLILAKGAADLPTTTCAPIPPGTITNLRDHHLGGLLDIPIPIGFVSLDVFGLKSDDACNVGDTIFQGRGDYTGGDTLRVTMSHALDCADFTSATETIRVLDLAKVIRNGADRCAAPADAAGLTIELQHLFVTFSGTDPLVGGDRPLPEVTVAANGLASVSGPHFSGAVEPSCLLASVYPPLASVWDYTSTCFNHRIAPDRTLCPGSTDELLLVPFDATDALYGVIARNYTSAAAGLVWDTTTGAPVANATVERISPHPGFTDGYFTMGSDGTITRAAGAQATTASGLFALEVYGPTTVVVRAPGYASRRIVLGADGSLGLQAIALTPP